MIQWWWLIPVFTVALAIGTSIPKILFLLEYFRPEASWAANVKAKFKAISEAGERERAKMWEAEQKRRRFSLEETSK